MQHQTADIHVHNRVSINMITSSSLMNQLSNNSNKSKIQSNGATCTISANQNTNIYPTFLNCSVPHQTADIHHRVFINSSSLMNQHSYNTNKAQKLNQIYKGNNKITEHRAIFQRERQNS